MCNNRIKDLLFISFLFLKDLFTLGEPVVCSSQHPDLQPFYGSLINSWFSFTCIVLSFAVYNPYVQISYYSLGYIW